MLPENENAAPRPSDQPEESPMSIFERRLAEIQARQNAAAPAPATPAPAAPAAEAAAASTTTDEITERPAQGAAAPTGEPAGAGTAEASADATPAAEPLAPAPEPAAAPAPAAAAPVTAEPAAPAARPEAAAPAAAPPTAPAAAEPAMPAASEPLARAESHYGAANPGVVSAHAAETEAPAPAAAPVVDLHSAAEIDAAPAALGTLPTSATDSAALAEAQSPAHADDEEEYVPETPAPDFTQLDLPGQASHLLGLLRRPDARQNRKQIFDLHRQYDTAVGADRTTARQQFVEQGGEADDFAYAGPAGHAELTKALQEFRESRARDAKAEDEQRAKNLVHKQYLLSQLRQLIESAETKDSSARIKALQTDWKATGPVPQKDTQELWNSYHALLDMYYNNRGLFFEMKELDRRRNLEAKEALVARAEALAGQSSINKALQELRQLHEEWKHIGPVPNEQRDAVWNRFLAASEPVHERKKEFLSARTAQESASLTRKTAILDQIKPFADFQTERVNEWRAKTDELQKLKEEWDGAGLVPRDKAEQLNKQFWGAYKGFFQRKNQFFKALDEEKNANLKRKLDLCEQADAALVNPNWEEGREIVIRLQKEWKLIGRVPEKQSDKVWNRFRTACDAFFERKNEEAKQRAQQAQQVSQEQAAHLDQVAEAVAALTPDAPGTLEGFQQQVAAWRAFDATGARGGGERAEEKFQSLMSKYLDAVPGLSYAERTDMLFQLQVERLKASADSQQALYKKEQALRRDINELENDIATLQTNLEFFARSKNASQLREEYQGRIDEAKGRIEGLKRQLKIVRS